MSSGPGSRHIGRRPTGDASLCVMSCALGRRGCLVQLIGHKRRRNGDSVGDRAVTSKTSNPGIAAGIPQRQRRIIYGIGSGVVPRAGAQAKRVAGGSAVVNMTDECSGVCPRSRRVVRGGRNSPPEDHTRRHAGTKHPRRNKSLRYRRRRSRTSGRRRL